jgi:hypothetical protein
VVILLIKIALGWTALSVLAGCLIYPLLKIAAAEDEAMRRLSEGGDDAN